MASDLSALGALQGYGQVGRVPSEPSAPSENPIASAAKEFANTFDRADQAVASMARGAGDAQAVVEAMAQAELALQTAVTIRDRVVEAYQEILRMPV